MFEIHSKEEYFFDPLQEAILQGVVDEIINHLEKCNNKFGKINISIQCGELLYQFIRAYYPYSFFCYGFVSFLHNRNFKNDEYKIKF